MLLFHCLTQKVRIQFCLKSEKLRAFEVEITCCFSQTALLPSYSLHQADFIHKVAVMCSGKVKTSNTKLNLVPLYRIERVQNASVLIVV